MHRASAILLSGLVGFVGGAALWCCGPPASDPKTEPNSPFPDVDRTAPEPGTPATPLRLTDGG